MGRADEILYTVRNNKADLSMLGFHFSQTRILISLICV